MEALLNLGFLFADDSRLYQVDKKKLSSTAVKVTFKSKRKQRISWVKKQWEFIALVLIVLYVKEEQGEKTGAKDHNSDLQTALK